MNRTSSHSQLDRRSFVKTAVGLGSAAMVAAFADPSSAFASRTAQFDALPRALRDRIGLQLFTVRDVMPTDYAGTISRAAQIGYKEVQTTLSYYDHTPQQVRQILDSAGLVAPTTHVSPPTGDDFERALEGYQLIGHRYTTVRLGAPAGAGGAARTRPAGGAPPAGAGQAGAARAPGGMQRQPTPPPTLDSVKRTAEQLNEAGLITRRHGIKVILHNHTEEFETLADSPLRPYDVILAETDPDLVAMELDIGWAAVAGQDAVEMFRRNPGRYEVWHVKDVAGLAGLEGLTIPERRRAARIVAMGQGDLDYRPIFAQAELAGMKHFYVEQDTAPDSGESLAEAARSYQFLSQLLA